MAFPSGWSYYKTITVEHTEVSADETDFPVPLNMGADSDFRDKANADGSDFVITNSDGSVQQKSEIESYDDGDGTLVMWFKGDISSSTDTDFRIYYGNASASETDDTEVWDDNYKMVQHMNEDPGSEVVSIMDSTDNNNDGTPYNMASGDLVSAQVGDGLEFTTADLDYVNFGTDDSLNITGDITIELWIKTPQAYDTIIDRYLASSPYTGYGLALDSASYAGHIRFYTDSIGAWAPSDSAVNDDNWHYVVVTGTNTGTDGKFYKDGSGDGIFSYSSPSSNSGETFYFGALNGSDNSYQGLLDELRLSNTVRNSNYIATSYNAMNSPTTFITLGAEEEAPVTIYGLINKFNRDNLLPNF